MNIIVTGFEPFHGETKNPSMEIIRCLADEIAGAHIIKLLIPTAAYTSLEVIHQAIETYEPAMVLSIGQAGGRSEISVERIGINIDDFSIPDNEGNQPIDHPIVENGETAYFTNLPIKAMVKRLREANIPAMVSNSAGTFVCNHVMYGVSYDLKKRGQNQKSGFIHVPFLPSQVTDKPGMPWMTLEDMVKGITIAIRAMIEVTNDDHISEGRIC